MSDVDTAVGLFQHGCACSQAILGAYGPRYGLSKEQAFRIAAGFAGGMRMASTCGAVTGSFMVLGLARGGVGCNTADGRQAAYAAVTSFAETFAGRHGSLLCRDLLGCDVSTPAGAALAKDQGLFATTCVTLVRDAAETVERMLARA